MIGTCFVILSLYSNKHTYHNSVAEYLCGENSNNQGTRNETLQSDKYAVFGCSTPINNSHRGYDYCFYLPLTARSWQRIGFKSIVLIIGAKVQWLNDPALSLVLVSLSQVEASVIFMDANEENRSMLSQTARIFVANMAACPARTDDYIISTDADLWPLRRDHFCVPRAEKKLVLVHSRCCGNFNLYGKTYRMLPMSHIGASAATWRQIINGNGQTPRDAPSILDYMERTFGPIVRRRVQYDSAEWYFDQKLISIKIDEWKRRGCNTEAVVEVSDAGFTRLDRARWTADQLSPRQFDKKYDAHLLLNGFLPDQWKRIMPLIELMYGKHSPNTKWADQYSAEFFQLRTQSST